MQPAGICEILHGLQHADNHDTTLGSDSIQRIGIMVGWSQTANAQALKMVMLANGLKSIGLLSRAPCNAGDVP